jgi:hypothetical protein
MPKPAAPISAAIATAMVAHSSEPILSMAYTPTGDYSLRLHLEHLAFGRRERDFIAVDFDNVVVTPSVPRLPQRQLYAKLFVTA